MFHWHTVKLVTTVYTHLFSLELDIMPFPVFLTSLPNAYPELPFCKSIRDDRSNSAVDRYRIHTYIFCYKSS